ncbi:MAG: M56 family metallopeptidase [Bryobacteraceae bacterium]
MTDVLVLRNLAAYSLQIGVIVTAGALLPALVRLRAPRARLIYWQVLLAACLVLPVLEPWGAPPPSRGAEVTVTTGATIAVAPHGPSLPVPAAWWALWTLGAGAVLRAGWLGLGFWRLRRYRTNARRLLPMPAEIAAIAHRLGVSPDVYLSGDLVGPVTFGARRAVVILPEHFLSLSDDSRRAIACHEFLHIRRGDWLFTVAEESVRCALWFHPCVWWLLGRIQLAREQTVDHAAVLLTADRERYLETLLDAAAVSAGLDLAPATLFLKKRHLSQRVASLLKETPMSKQRLVSSLVTISGVAILAMRLSVALFPLQAPAQETTQSPGVSVELGQYHLLHGTPVQYPRAAREHGIEGVVQVDASVDETGAVTDARVLSGPPELRKAVLESVLDWHFSTDGGLPPAIPVTVRFSAADAGPSPGLFNAPPAKVKQIVLSGMPGAMRERLNTELPVHIGDLLTPEVRAKLDAAVANIDEHLVANVHATPDGAVVTIYLPERRMAVPMASVSPGAPLRIRVGGNVQAANLIEKIYPVYPPEAKQARVQGTVALSVVINKDGTVANVDLISGDPLLAPTAIDAVKQWIYRPTLLNGQPVEVSTQVNVNFTLSK